MAASAAQKGVDLTTVVFVELDVSADGWRAQDRAADTAIVIQPFLSRITASNDGTLLAYYVRDSRPGVSGAVFAAKRTWAKANVPTIKAWRAAFDEGAADATAHPDEARDTAAKFLKLPSDDPDFEVEFAADG